MKIQAVGLVSAICKNVYKSVEKIIEIEAVDAVLKEVELKEITVSHK